MKNEDVSLDVSLEEIDRVIHEPARLNIMLYLFVVEKADFVYLVHKTGLTKGNLSVHLQKLEQSGYVEILKEFVGRIPYTLIRLTKQGRKAFIQYREDILSLHNQT